MAAGLNLPTPQALRDLDLGSFIGQSVADLQSAVEQVGGVLRVYRAGGALHADYRPNRVTAMIDDGVLVEVNGIG